MLGLKLNHVSKRGHRYTEREISLFHLQDIFGAARRKFLQNIDISISACIFIRKYHKQNSDLRSKESVSSCCHTYLFGWWQQLVGSRSSGVATSPALDRCPEHQETQRSVSWKMKRSKVKSILYYKNLKWAVNKWPVNIFKNISERNEKHCYLINRLIAIHIWDNTIIETNEFGSRFIPFCMQIKNFWNMNTIYCHKSTSSWYLGVK